MHNEFVGGVKNGKRVQVGAWIHGQLARIGLFHAVLDEETMNLGLLTARNCTSQLIVGISDRKEPVKLAFPLQVVYISN